MRTLLLLLLLCTFTFLHSQTPDDLKGNYSRNVLDCKDKEVLSLQGNMKFKLSTPDPLTGENKILNGSWSSKNQLIFLDFGEAKVEKYKKLISIEGGPKKFKLCYHSNPNVSKKTKYFVKETHP